jgi:hypothetical protein
MTSTRPRVSGFRSPARVAAGVLLLAVIVVGVWWLMLGHDQTYQYDADGTASGPYEALQVLLFIVALALVTFAAGLLLPAWAVAATVTVALTAAWSIQASSKDLTGLWAVGAIGVLLGTAIGSGLVAFAAHLVGSMRPRPIPDSA